MTLYGSLTSPYVRKARILLAEKQIACGFVETQSGAVDSPVPALNPLGLVPVLVRDDDWAMFDSPVIIEYLDTLKPPALIPAGGEPRWRVLRWAALADGILDQCAARTVELYRPPARQWQAANLRREQRIARALAFAERDKPAGPYLADERLTLADIAVTAALDYIDFRYPHDWRAAAPGLAAWHAAIAQRPAFASTRPPR